MARSGVAIVLTGLFLALSAATYLYSCPLPRGSSGVTVYVAPGSSTARVAELLYEKGLIRNPLAFRALARIMRADGRIQSGEYRFEPAIVACDLHPDYASTAWARASGLPVVAVQHHQAHVASCAAENDVAGGYLGVGWDGTGYGLDGTVWGGEFFLARGGGFERIAHLRPFRLPGGDAAVKEGWRTAASLLYETFGAAAVPECPNRQVLIRMIESGLNSPLTTSVGRLFDAVASIAGIARENRFEGQAAMLLERAIGSLVTADCYPLGEKDNAADWAPLIEAVHADARRGVPVDWISARFHNALVAWILRVAERAGAGTVVLSGGVFQNGYLAERAAAALEERGFRVATHQRVPANDGGISLGQAVIAGLAAP